MTAPALSPPRIYGNALKRSLDAAKEHAELRAFVAGIANMTTSSEYTPIDPDDHRCTMDSLIAIARKRLAYPADFKPEIPCSDDDSDWIACTYDGLILGVGEDEEAAFDDACGTDDDPADIGDDPVYATISPDALQAFRAGFDGRAFVFVETEEGTRIVTREEAGK